jgi:futalosine hydrolase
MKILLTAATDAEIKPLREYLSAACDQIAENRFNKNSTYIKLLVTGIGAAQTAFHLGRELSQENYQLALNAGIAGSFQPSIPTGTVVQVISERFADLGIEDKDGSFADLVEAELMLPNQSPFVEGMLLNQAGAAYDFLPRCSGITVNKVHGWEPSISAIRKKYRADVESMEGAAFFLACLLSGVPFLEIRAVSNFVEPRKRENWDIPLAVENLNRVLRELLETFLFEAQ